MQPFICLALLVSSSTPRSSVGHDAAHIVTSPSASVLVGDPVHIKLTGLPPNGQATLRMDLHDEWGGTWRSEAVYKASSSGTINLDTDAPLSGDYTGVDPRGLFWSGKQLNPSAKVTNETSPATNADIDLSLLQDGNVTATKTLRRWFTTNEVASRTVRESGLVGTLYVPKNGRNLPTVVLVGGSGGGITWQRVTAVQLASRGYAALALAYFKMDDLPKGIDRLPLEYFENSIGYLKRQPEVDQRRIGVIGYSVGAELALLASSTFPELKTVVAYAPSYVVFQSYAAGYPDTSKWSYHGQPLPYVPFDSFDPKLTSVENWTNYLKNTEAVKKAVIPVEKINGAVLLFSGEADAVWPSTMMAEKVIDRLHDHHFKFEIEHDCYPNAGHAIAKSGWGPTIFSVQNNNNGGDAQGTAKAQADSWRRLLGFLSRNLVERKE